jgi:hypothetical protein
MNNDLEIQKMKLQLIQWLSTVEDKSVLEKLSDFISRNNEKDWWSDLSSKEIISIENGINDAKTGKVNPHSKARKLYEKWL